MWTFGDYLLRKISPEDNNMANQIINVVMREYNLPPHDEAGTSPGYNIASEYADDFFGIVEYQGAAVGTIALKKLTLSQGMLKKNYLLKPHRGKGVGTFMLQKVLTIGREMGLSEVILETSGLLEDAIHLYKKNGFIMVYNNSDFQQCGLKFSLALK